ncbi:MAG TPA: hypothetical protein VFC92_03030 [Bacteroidales bacterium]|nr:hypothetical protein [Bacteroidales bacterium]
MANLRKTCEAPPIILRYGLQYYEMVLTHNQLKKITHGSVFGRLTHQIERGCCGKGIKRTEVKNPESIDSTLLSHSINGRHLTFFG